MEVRRCASGAPSDHRTRLTHQLSELWGEVWSGWRDSNPRPLDPRSYGGPCHHALIDSYSWTVSLDCSLNILPFGPLPRNPLQTVANAFGLPRTLHRVARATCFRDTCSSACNLEPHSRRSSSFARRQPKRHAVLMDLTGSPSSS